MKSFLFAFIPPPHCLFHFVLSSLSIDTCVQTQRASAISLVKSDLCWTHMVQHTFEMIRSHLFISPSHFLFLFSRFLLRFFLLLIFFSLPLSLPLSLSPFVLHPAISFESNPSIANVAIISNTSIIQIILKKTLSHSVIVE